MVDLKSHNVAPTVPAPPTAISPEAVMKEKAPISEQVRQAVQMKLKKRRNSEHSDDDDDEEDDVDEEEDESALVIDEPKETVKTEAPADLASVSKLLNNAVAQSFQQYFNQHREESEENSAEKHHARSPSEGNTDEMDEGECTSISDGHSGGSDFGGHPSDGGREKGKKKSAYSNAPHRVSCPYCSRKFPWTSSLRRHILTHTGQKPYKCPQCPLWFTTKSNCDRHLLRKHGNVIHGHSASTPAALPERFKCALCPSLVFSSAENLKKHVDAKHCPGSPDSMGDEEKASRPATPADGQSGEQLPYKCHLCDDHNGFAERQEVLDHLQIEHTDEFHDLVGKVGALVAEPPPMSNHTSDEGEDYDSVRGKFPDYANRKVSFYLIRLYLKFNC